MNKYKKIAIIGGGMSGMVASIIAAQRGYEVVLFERQDRVGKKILLTGNGRCNISNTEINRDCYITDDSDCLNKILLKYRDVEKEFWNSLGLLTKEKNGCIYPISGQAATILDLLRYQMRDLSVEVIKDCFVTNIKKDKQFFYIIDSDNKVRMRSDIVILSCGGKAGVYKEEKYNGFSLAKNLGHSILPCYPALVQTICQNADFKMIAGVRADVKINLYIDNKLFSTEQGELQITEKGLSGIAVFQHTRYLGEALKIGKACNFTVDFLPAVTKEQWTKVINQQMLRYGNRSMEEFLEGFLHKKLAIYFTKKCNIKTGTKVNDVSKNLLNHLFQMIREWKVEITGLNSFAQAQISTGGVPLSEVNEHMESRIVDGLYLTGEMLNVNGACGGYNLYFAAASGYLAANSIS